MNRNTRREHQELIIPAGREYRCLFRRDAGGGYRVTCPDLPPVLAFGDTLEEARVNVAEDLAAWLELRDAADGPSPEMCARLLL